MGTKLSDYVDNEGRAMTPDSVRRRRVLAQAYTLAGDLIELRQRLGLSQQQLADQSGVAQSEISRIERGAVHPTDTTWARLAEALGAEVRIVPIPEGRHPTTKPSPAPARSATAKSSAASSSSR